MTNTARTTAEVFTARAADLRAEICKAREAVENAAYRFEVLGSDTYIENGKTHFYPKGKAALTRLRKRQENLRRLEARLAATEAAIAAL
jgi:Mn-dependent DtxR family transcriptional regulator